MTEISNESIYTGLNRIYFFTKTTDISNGGVFDWENTIQIDKYRSNEIFIPETDLFDDSIYEGRECIIISFKHFMFSFAGLKFGPGHLHERIILSTDPALPITDMYHRTPSGDIMVFGTPLNINGREINDDQGNVKLWEIEPFLNKDDMKSLINDINACTTFKREMVKSAVRAQEATTEAALQLQRAVSAESVNITYFTIIKVLLAKYEQTVKKLIEMRISSNNLLQEGVERIEAELDLDVPWNEINKYDGQRMIEDIRSDINYLQALKNTNPEPSEQVKAYAYSLCLEICGNEYMMQRLNSNEPQPKHINTLGGLTTNYIAREMKANPSSQELQSSLSTFLNLLRRKFDTNGGDLRKAVDEMNGLVNTGNLNNIDQEFNIPPLNPTILNPNPKQPQRIANVPHQQQ